MADLVDVEKALVDLVAATIYPLGTKQASIVGSQCRIYRGWPVSAGLNSDLASGIINISISPDEAPGKTTTRYLLAWQTNASTPTTTITSHDNIITIGGTPSAGDVVGALLNGKAYAYRVLATDTTNLIAAALSAEISATISNTLSGATITVNQPATIITRSVRDATTSTEGRRQEKDIRIICWCPDPTSRDTISSAIDQAVVKTPFLMAADGSSARISYRNTAVYDQAQNANLFRRDLVYTAEYPTIYIQSAPSMLFGGAAIGGNIQYG